MYVTRHDLHNHLKRNHASYVGDYESWRDFLAGCTNQELETAHVTAHLKEEAVKQATHWHTWR